MNLTWVSVIIISVVVFLSTVHGVEEEEGETVITNLCNITTPNYSTLDTAYSEGEGVEVGTLFGVYCNSEFQLRNSPVAEILCETDEIPSSCRKIVISTVVTEYSVGNEVTMTCTVTADDTVTGIRWLKDDTEFREQGEFGAEQSSPFRSVLTFTSTAQDSGIYSCEATMDADPPYDQEVSLSRPTLTILDVDMEPAEKTVYLRIGENFPLECSFRKIANYMLTVSWTRTDGETVPMYDSESEDGSLVSRPTVKATTDPAASNTNYICRGLYRNIQTGAEIVVSDSRLVIVRDFTIQPISLSLSVGDTAVFTCEAMGEGRAEYSWVVGTETETATSTYTVQYRTTKTVLNLLSVTRQTTQVVCTMTYGDQTLTSDPATLSVFDIGFVTSPETRVFRQGESYEMTCALRTESGNTTPTVTWYKDNKLIAGNKYSGEMNEAGTEYMNRLYFSSVRASDAGEYFCRAQFFMDTGTIAMVTDSVPVYVRNALFFPSVQHLVSDSEADVKYFYCFYTGDSEPGIGVESVSWWANGQDVTDLENFTVNNELFTKETSWKTDLTISNISPSLAGVVECRYKCGLGGYIAGETHLYVHRAVAMPAETLTASSTYTITCSTRSNEPATVTWKKDGVKILINDANFEIQQSVIDDYIQTNTLVVKGWSSSNEVTAITCLHTYETTKNEQSSSTNLIYKGFTGSPRSNAYYNPSVKVLYCSFGFTYNLSPPKSAQWLKNGADIAGDARFEENIHKQTGNWEMSLRIAGDGPGSGGGTIADSGAYTCRFIFSEEETYEKTANIHFYTLSTEPDESQFYNSPSLTLSCVLDSQDVVVSGVEWVRGDTTLTEPDFRGDMVDAGVATLTIAQVKEENSGAYTCRISVADDTLEATKSIEIRDIEMSSEEYITVKEGDTLTLSCSVHYFSEEDAIAWYRDGTLVTDDVTPSRSSPVLTSVLSIDSMQIENLGEYKCGIGEFRSLSSVTVGASEITIEEDIILRGETATVGCTVSEISSQPTKVHWKDGDGNVYDDTTNSDGAAVFTLFQYNAQDATQRTTLQIEGVVTNGAAYSCYFDVDHHTNKRSVSVTVLEIETTPSLTYTGSDTTVQCRIVNLPLSSIVTVAWTAGSDSYGPGDVTDAQEGTMTSQLALSGVDSDVTMTCTFILDGGEGFSKTVQVTTYEVTAPGPQLVETGESLTLHLQLIPEDIDPTPAVRDLTVSEDSTVNGQVQVSGLSVVYPSIDDSMAVTYTFSDTNSIMRSLSTAVYAIQLDNSQVYLSDGKEPVHLRCVMSIDTIPADVRGEIGAFWVSGDGARIEHAIQFTEMVAFSEMEYEVSSETTDMLVPCGFSYKNEQLFHSQARLDIVDIQCSEDMELKNDSINSLECTISGSQNTGPKAAIWFRGKTQMLIQDLSNGGWPEAVTTTLFNVTEPGKYRCVVEFADTEFSNTVAVTQGAVEPVDPVEPIDPVEPVDPDSKSGKQLAIAIGVSVPVIVLCGVLIIFFLCYVKKIRMRKTSYKTPHPTPYNHPASLVYHNESSRTADLRSRPSKLTLDTGPTTRTAASYVTKPRNGGDAVYNNPSFDFSDNTRKSAPPPRPLPPQTSSTSKRPAPTPPKSLDSLSRLDSPTRPSRPPRPTVEVKPTRPERPRNWSAEHGTPSPDSMYSEPTVTLDSGFNSANYSSNMVPKPPGREKVILDPLESSDI